MARWQLTLCDPIWHVTLSNEMGLHKQLYKIFNLYHLNCAINKLKMSKSKHHYQDKDEQVS